MENKGLVFIPDISGFTRFVNETEIEHSRLIIQELLEVLIEANKTGLQVSEIEGDAILFYRFGEPPPLDQVYRQVEEMFCAFHNHLFSYDHQRYCFCKACNAAIHLTLKVISHYGEFTGYKVQQFNKLIGKDIIVAHQLLKNDISNHEYWLVTNNLFSQQRPLGPEDWMVWNSSRKQTENGEILYHYTALTPLKKRINAIPPERPSLRDSKKVISVTATIDRNLISLFHAVGDFRNRHLWFDGVRSVEEVSHSLPRIGMKCKKFTDAGESMLYSTNYAYSDYRIEFMEREEHSNEITSYVLEKSGDEKSTLTLNYYVRNTFTNVLLFNLFRKKEMEERFRKSLKNLASFMTTFETEVSQTPVPE